MSEPKKGFACTECGKWHEFSLYVMAHWNDMLQHKCECGAVHSIRKGVADLDHVEAAGDYDE